MNPPEVLFEGRFLRVRKKDRWEYVERCTGSGVVAVLAVTETGEILLVEQFRLAVNRRVIEIPAGLSGDLEGGEHEELAEAAKRELLEETGYEAPRMEYLMEGPSSAGLCTEIITFFRADAAIKVAKGGGDDSEEIQVHAVPLVEVESWLEAKRNEGCLIDYKIQAVLYFELRRSAG